MTQWAIAPAEMDKNLTGSILMLCAFRQKTYPTQ
jgi:hypothetical protein